MQIQKGIIIGYFYPRHQKQRHNVKDEYNKEKISFRFVKTENGWRAAEFLNAEKTDAVLLMG